LWSKDGGVKEAWEEVRP
jgi:hypothetical protein